LNAALGWLQGLRDAFLPPQLRLLELHFKFVHNRALHAAATLGVADLVPPVLGPNQLVHFFSSSHCRSSVRECVRAVCGS
jgi:hypothetical protein